MPHKDKAAFDAYHAKYREERREGLAAQAKAYREKERERINARRRAAYANDSSERKARTRSYYLQNRDRVLASNKDYQRRTWRIQAGRRLLKNFGLTYDAYLAKVDVQDGVCWICLLPESASRGHDGYPNNLAVDHDRRCCPGKRSCGRCVRHLLCQSCNVTLGQVLERRETLVRMLSYLGEAVDGGPRQGADRSP